MLTASNKLLLRLLNWLPRVLWTNSFEYVEQIAATQFKEAVVSQSLW